jgi:hypothetical protein
MTLLQGLKKWMKEHKVSVVDLDWDMLNKHNISMTKLLRWELSDKGVLPEIKVTTEKLIPNLTIHHAKDGCWLRLKVLNGSEVCLNLNAITDKQGPMTRKILLQWIAEHKKRNSKCRHKR